MARLNKKLKKMDQDHRAAIMMHVRALNLRTIEEYESWCQENGFSASVKKSLTQRRKEYILNNSKAADVALKKHSKESKLRTQITQIYNNELTDVGFNN